MTSTPTARLSDVGVSIWLDDLSRDRITSGSLERLIAERNVVGVTTNPTIFAAALATGTTYDEQIRELAASGADVTKAVFEITTDDVARASDIFASVSEATGGRDGRVSIEVEPGLAHDAAGTAQQARELWARVDRPNLLIKIPATLEGLPAIARTIGQGISVNVTLIFSPDRYRKVMDAYLSGLEERLAQDADADLSGIASVASFFVSRVDTEIDKRLDAAGADPSLKGKAGVANAQLAYQAYEEVFSSDRWRALEAKGARPQWPLWASTGVKNPDLPDTLYISELIAPGTVNTMPEKTLKAYADHGSPGTPVQKAYDDAAAVMQSVRDAGVDLDDVFRVLEDEGVQKFVDSWDELTESVRTQLEDKK